MQSKYGANKFFRGKRNLMINRRTSRKTTNIVNFANFKLYIRSWVSSNIKLKIYKIYNVVFLLILQGMNDIHHAQKHHSI